MRGRYDQSSVRLYQSSSIPQLPPSFPSLSLLKSLNGTASRNRAAEEGEKMLKFMQQGGKSFDIDGSIHSVQQQEKVKKETYNNKVSRVCEREARIL